MTYLDHPINDYHPYGAVFHEVLALSHGLMNLFPAGIMFRGAISVGDIFVDPEDVYKRQERVSTKSSQNTVKILE